MNHCLEFDGIEKGFSERTVLSSIYISCAVGQVVALLGRNGSGKSTLMQIVFGSMSASSQSVRINREPILKSRIRMEQIGYLPQKKFIPSALKISQVLEDYNILPEALIEYFPDFKNRVQYRVNQLSGGLLRILEVFIILKSGKPFVMLDEPFSGIMPIHIEVIKQLIAEEKTRKGVFISDHLYRHALDIADCVYLLRDGKTYKIEDHEELVFRGYMVG